MRDLRIGDEQSFLLAVRAFAADDGEWQFAFDFDPQEEFAAYVKRVHNWPDGHGPSIIDVANSYLVAVVDNEIIGRLSLRHELNEGFRRYGGHIGYGIIPGKRNRGYGTEILRQGLRHSSEMIGLDQVLLTCEVSNISSRKVIEKNHGVLSHTQWVKEAGAELHFFYIDLKNTKLSERLEFSVR